jgi:hypothetical protein
MKDNYDDFTKKHLNRIKVMQSALKGKIYIECMPTDIGAIAFPNSNFAIKELVLYDVPDEDTYASELKQENEKEKAKSETIARALAFANQENERLRGLLNELLDVSFKQASCDRCITVLQQFAADNNISLK